MEGAPSSEPAAPPEARAASPMAELVLTSAAPSPQVLEDAIRQIHARNAGCLSFEELYRRASLSPKPR